MFLVVAAGVAAAAGITEFPAVEAFAVKLQTVGLGTVAVGALVRVLLLRAAKLIKILMEGFECYWGNRRDSAISGVFSGGLCAGAGGLSLGLEREVRGIVG